MIEQGHAVLYWGEHRRRHGAPPDNGSRAQMMACEYSFLWPAAAAPH